MKPYYQDDRVVIYHDDCLKILPVLSRNNVDVLITDPPYGVNLGNHSGAKEKRSGLLVKTGGYQDDEQYYDSVVVEAIKMSLAIVKRGAVFGVPPMIWKLPPPDVIGGIFVPSAVGRNRWGWTNLIHCLFYGTAPDLNKGAGSTVIRSTATAEKTGHPATKPLEWMKWLVGLASREGEVIFDPFMGSGTTGIAAVLMNRRFIGIEIKEEYVEIAVRRITENNRQTRMF